MGWLYLVVSIVIVLGLSFTASLVETVFLSITSDFSKLISKRDQTAGIFLTKFLKAQERTLASLALFNIIVLILGAAGTGVGAYILVGIGWVVLVSGGLAFFVLVFTETFAKSLGQKKWKTLARPSIYVIFVILIVTYPFAVILEALWRKTGTKKIGGRIDGFDPRQLAPLGQQEKKIMENLRRFKHIKAQDIMTPRSVIYSFPRQRTIGQIVKKGKPLRFSRIPIYDRDIDSITGLVLRYEIFKSHAEGKVTDEVHTIEQPINVVPFSVSITKLLDEFIHRREHLFLVVDEYGGTAGIISLEDCIESLIGVEIIDELDIVEDMRKYARDKSRKKFRKQRVRKKSTAR